MINKEVELIFFSAKDDTFSSPLSTGAVRGGATKPNYDAFSKKTPNERDKVPSRHPSPVKIASPTTSAYGAPPGVSDQIDRWNETGLSKSLSVC